MRAYLDALVDQHNAVPMVVAVNLIAILLGIVSLAAPTLFWLDCIVLSGAILAAPLWLEAWREEVTKVSQGEANGQVTPSPAQSSGTTDIVEEVTNVIQDKRTITESRVESPGKAHIVTLPLFSFLARIVIVLLPSFTRHGRRTREKV